MYNQFILDDQKQMHIIISDPAGVGTILTAMLAAALIDRSVEKRSNQGRFFRTEKIRGASRMKKRKIKVK